MSWLLPRSLVGRLGLVLVVALIAGQAIAVAIFLSENSRVDRAVARTREADRTATLVRAIDAAPASSRDAIIQAFGTPRHRYWMSATPSVANAAMGEQEQQVARRLQRMSRNHGHDARIALVSRSKDAEDDFDADSRTLPHALNISVQLADGSWLNAAAPLRLPTLPEVNVQWLYLLAASVAGVVAAVVFAVRWITRPLTALADAADRVGRGEAVEQLTATGPYEIARTVKAFNVMQHRLSRFVGDRLAMLASISHDLRTPMTAARLRAEMIDNTEVRDAIVRSLTEMQYITETTLSFARDETASEEPRMIDLASLVEAVADDLAATGQNIAVTGDDHLHYRCRPALMRRALFNLIGNATKYGKRACVALHLTEEHARITIDDDGPGLPQDQLEKVFEPFVRAEPSRSSDTGGTGVGGVGLGGVGLGLSIARTIIRAHGGDVRLSNLDRGLRAEIVLPRTA
jgi:signal transduction histidine kinase